MLIGQCLEILCLSHDFHTASYNGTQMLQKAALTWYQGMENLIILVDRKTSPTDLLYDYVGANLTGCGESKSTVIEARGGGNLPFHKM